MIRILKRDCHVLEQKCIRSITVNPTVCQQYILNSISVVTALTPILAYEKCCAIAKQALESGKTVNQVLRDEGIISNDKIDQLLNFHDTSSIN
jgi:aspartate ammonia-lyase